MKDERGKKKDDAPLTRRAISVQARGICSTCFFPSVLRPKFICWRGSCSCCGQPRRCWPTTMAARRVTTGNGRRREAGGSKFPCPRKKNHTRLIYTIAQQITVWACQGGQTVAHSRASRGHATSGYHVLCRHHVERREEGERRATQGELPDNGRCRDLFQNGRIL